MASPVAPAAGARRGPGRRRRYRWLWRAGAVLLAVVLLLGVALGVLWVRTPGVGDAMTRVRAVEVAHHAPHLGVLPRSDRVAQALVATEDSRFWSDPGVDPLSVVRAGLATLVGSNDVGGATLEQQLAKNLWFGGRRDRVAQAEEVVVALKLDRAWTKDQVLRMYLGQVYFGHGYYGLDEAARGYFGLAPSQLSWAQASMLAGLVQAPTAYDPVTHLAAGKQRQRHVLDRLVSTGVLSAAAADAAYAAPLHLR